MTVHHKRCHEENIELYYYRFSYAVIVPRSALTHNGHSVSGFKLRSGGTRLTCSSPPFPAWQFVSYQSVTSDELPGTRPARDLGGTEGGLKPLILGGDGGAVGLPMLFGMGICKQQFCLIKP